MKTVMFKISDRDPKDGDLMLLSFTTPRGGVSSVRYRIKREIKSAYYDEATGEPKLSVQPADTPGDIAKGLADGINAESSEFCKGEFHAVAREDLLIVTLSDRLADAYFMPQQDGTSNGIVEL